MSQISLRRRLLLCCGGIVALVWIVMLATTLVSLRNYSREQMLRYTKIVMENLIKSNRDYLAFYDYHRIRSMIKDSAYIDGLEYIAIYDDTGRLIASYPSYNSPLYEHIDKYITPDDNQALIRHEKMINDAVLSVFESTVYDDKTRRNIGKIQIAVSEAKTFSPFNHVLNRILLLGVLLILALVCALGWLINQVIKPMSHLAKICKNATLSTLDGLEKVKPNSPEVSSLVDSFRGFSRRILDQERQLTEQKVHVALGEIASRVAHDIRSPLSALQGAGRILKQHLEDNANAMNALNLLQLSGARLENIANDLLARNMDGSGKPSSAFSICEVVDELVGEYQASPAGNGTLFEKRHHSSALYITGDRTGISRAIGNIIKNALDAMQGNAADKPRQLSVSTDCYSNDNMMIRITDTGCGIPADKIPIILLGGHTEGKMDGHGIGTKVAREMVEGHGGSLSIESKVGEGTTFILILPLTDTTRAQADGATITIPSSDGGSITIIDDEPSLREQWRLTLKTQNVETKVFSGWEEFVASHPEAQPKDPNSTFIIDYHFDNSEVDGLEIIRRLKGRGYVQFVLATAEYWKPSIKDSAQKLGVILCPKPLPRVVVKKTPLLCREGPGEVGTLPHPASPYKGEGKTSGPNVLVIDDDASIRMCWKMQRELFGIGNLHIYSTMEECENNKPNYNQVDMAFIDKHIEGSQWRLDQVIAHLKTNGVRKVWVASGETAEDLKSDPSCAAADGIVNGKMPQSLEDYSA